MAQETLTLYELNRRVRSVLERTFVYDCWLQAELSEVHPASSGHCYVEFVQKDSAGRGLLAKARGTIWASRYRELSRRFEADTGERLRAGLTVCVQVGVSFHELYGYSLNITDIDPSYTLGDMARRRRAILARLEADGILEDNRLLPLPRLLKRVAVISSETAAGYGDFRHQLEHNEYGLHFSVDLFPAVMQGAQVEESVLEMLDYVVASAGDYDCVVIIRGGGATSDLSDFDTYALAEAVAQMPLPVIVGIGHERDETVLDYVAHTRVKTPTAAAAFLIAHQAAELSLLLSLQGAVNSGAAARLRRERERLERHASLLPRIFALVGERQRQRLLLTSNRLRSAVQAHIARQHFRLQLAGQRLEALDPARQLRRGFSLTYGADGRLLRSADGLADGEQLTTQLAEGCILSRYEAPSGEPPTP